MGCVASAHRRPLREALNLHLDLGVRTDGNQFAGINRPTAGPRYETHCVLHCFLKQEALDFGPEALQLGPCMLSHAFGLYANIV